MIIDICEIIMNNHTCEIIDFISGGKINKTLDKINETLNNNQPVFPDGWAR